MDSKAIKGEEKKLFKHYLGKEQCFKHILWDLAGDYGGPVH